MHAENASQTFVTRQFIADSQPAVHIPQEIAFPPGAELLVVREGGRIVITPVKKNLGALPGLFRALGKHFTGGRVEFDEAERRL